MAGWLGRAVLGALLVGLLGLAPEARAQSGSERFSALEQARRRMEQGQAYFLQGRFGEAAAEFEAAYGLQSFAAFLFNAGLSHEHAGELTRALDLFERFAREETIEARRTEARSHIDSLRARITAAQPTPSETPPVGTETPPVETPPTPPDPATPSGTPPPQPIAPPTATEVEELLSLVSIATDPAGATVTITRGAELVANGPAPLHQSLDAGRYHLLIVHPSFNRFEHDFDVRPGVLNQFFLNLSQGEFLGYVRVTSDPPGAAVFIDDREHGARGQTPFEGPLRTGRHTVWIERNGFVTAERTFEVSVAQEIAVEVDLERTSHGRLRVVGNIRGARILVDDVEMGTVPWEGNVPAGDRHVRVIAAGYKDWEGILAIPRGQLLPIRVAMAESMDRTGAVVSAIFGLMLVGGAVATTLYVNDLHATLERQRLLGTLDVGDSRITLGEALTYAQYGGYGVGGLLGVLAIYYAVYDDHPPSRVTQQDVREWTLLPQLAPGLVGLSASGRF